MTKRPDGSPGRRDYVLCGLVLIVLVATIVVAILAYRKTPPAPPRGSSTMPAQAAEGSGATPR